MDQRPSSDPSPGGHDLPQTLAVCGFLLLAVGLVFGPTVGHEFINLDDDVCVYENPWITHGLTADAIKWAFSNRHGGNSDPLTWISHIVDWQFYGGNAGGHHLTNVLLHAATVVLLFLVLQQMSARPWPSALAAALFAIHPLRVESVAWVTERKDVLSGLFFMLTLWAYTSYARRPFSLVRYLAVMILFVLGLMSKPMLMTLPCVLLLLDYWPLKRLGPPWKTSAAVRLVIEKLPLLALSAACCAVTVWAQHVELHEPLPAEWRIGNALIAYVVYLGQFFCPAGLAPLHPRRELLDTSLWAIFGAGVVLIGVTAAAWATRRKWPYLLVGWLWYLGMLLPVIGLLPFGSEGAADRFTYLPQIGLCIAVVWGAADLCRPWPYRRWVCGVSSALVLAVLMGCAARQVSFWHDSQTLWARTLACTSQNFMAHRLYGNALAADGRIDEAEEQFLAAIRILPTYTEAWYSLGVAEADRGRMDQAMAYYRRAIEANANNANAHNNLGHALLFRGEYYEALKHFQEALRVVPDFAAAHYNQGLALHALGHLPAAAAEYQEALKIQPDYAEAYYNLGIIFASRGRRGDAAECYRAALKIKPNFTEARMSLEALSAGQRP